MNCRPTCGACCIAPSISSAMPGNPKGKAAGVPCPHLDEVYRCRLFGSPLRPSVCVNLQPSLDMCGQAREEALAYLEDLECVTKPYAKTSGEKE